MEQPAASSSNRLLRAGGNVLSTWCVLNALPGIGSLVFLAMGRHAPGLRMVMSAAAVEVIEPRVRAAADGIAVIANTLIVAYCALAFFVVRRCILRGDRLARWTLGATLVLIQVAAYASDALYFSGQNAIATHLSSAILVLGFSLCAWGDRPSAPGSR